MKKLGAVFIVLLSLFTACAAGAVVSQSATATQFGVKVQGNKLVNLDNVTVQLRGVNFSGQQYACAEGWGLFDAPAIDASITALKSWKVTAVRVPLNESCWLGNTNVKAQYRGVNYQNAIVGWVNKLTSAGIYVIVDDHHSRNGTAKATGQQAAANRDNTPRYWQSVATAFKSNPAVLFDLYNEPYPDRNRDTVAAWKCVRDGGTCPGVNFVAAGHQELLNAVRSTGATNVVLVSGPEYAGNLTRWLEYKPTDPANQLAASVHIYGRPLGSPYDTQATWTKMLPTAAQVPIIMGEIGDSDCTSKFSPPLMRFADTNGMHYLAWGWVVANCADEPSLIKNYAGAPTKFGEGVRTHLLSK